MFSHLKKDDFSLAYLLIIFALIKMLKINLSYAIRHCGLKLS